MPTLRSSLDRSLGRILVPSRFQTSGVDLTNDETANFKRHPFRSGQLAKGTVQGSGEEIGMDDDVRVVPGRDLQGTDENLDNGGVRSTVHRSHSKDCCWPLITNFAGFLDVF